MTALEAHKYDRVYNDFIDYTAVSVKGQAPSVDSLEAHKQLNDFLDET